MTDTEVKYTRHLDRTDWPAGPWVDEPDRAEWRDEATGLVCLAKRHPWNLNWCGYVGLPPGHPLHGKKYSSYGEESDAGVPEEVESAPHGGLTYADHCQEDDRPIEERICHVAQPGEPDALWWLGFDCHHAFDLAPGMMRREAALILPPLPSPLPHEVYRDIEYVKNEITTLALACAAVTAPAASSDD